MARTARNLIPFLSGPPLVHLENAFVRPYENAVATARTCYSSSGVLRVEDVSGDGLPEEKRKKKAEQRDRIAQSTYRAGHHTTLQHAHFQFTIDQVSRHCIWSFLHSHPFYNSEQVSQRYVTVKPGHYAIPPLEGAALAVYRETCDGLVGDYQRLTEVLTPVASAEYFRRFKARRPEDPKWRSSIQKKAQEVARYVLPVAIHAYLYHTVSALTLLRYHRACDQFDTPLEQRLLVDAMVAAVLRHDPLFEQVVEDPLALEETPEWRAFRSFAGARENGAAAEFRREFDASLEGRTSKLVAWKHGQEALLAASVREVFGLPRAALSDDAAIRLALAPDQNPLLGQSLKVGMHTKLSRCLQHVSYTFRKKLSHTADSQDQRHRMVPASRPILSTQLSDEPDFITPALVRMEPRAEQIYGEAMTRAFDGRARLRRLGVSAEFADYVLPNAVAIRFTESGDLLSLHHKLVARLCYNAQEEIFAASLDEAQQIAAVDPRIGAQLGAPCLLRMQGGVTPYCPEGDRYCGVPVWKLALEQYERTI
ncbi:MAG: FAD-dependent thymidylate synthase [Planctomycetes bacterium]|nr:FAD-dependent thymidylate synthase [Planctomycetota bacterium]